MSEVTATAAQATPLAAAATPAVTPPVVDAKTAQQSAAITSEPAKAAPDAKVITAAEPGKEKAAEVSPPIKEETKPPSEQKSVVPEKYDLKKPKDSALSDAQLEKLSSYAKEKGFSNEQAQSLLERESEAVSAYISDLKETQSKMTTQWFEQAQKDTELGGDAFKENAELAKRVVAKFGTDEFRKELDKTGLGNHPELLRIFSRVGKAMAEDKLILAGEQVGNSKSAADFLYGNTPIKESTL